MFKGMPTAFWIGCSVTYGWAFLFMICEWTIPGFPLKSFMGVPACWIYNCLLCCFVVNVFVAWYYAFAEEQREKKLEEKKK
ncbi:MAG: hypothetical protein HGA41_08960 [Syntrophaceae bacterium]|nr:hypothetical protein [Syntrophaceae bacterium]